MLKKNIAIVAVVALAAAVDARDVACAIGSKLNDDVRVGNDDFDSAATMAVFDKDTRWKDYWYLYPKTSRWPGPEFWQPAMNGWTDNPGGNVLCFARNGNPAWGGRKRLDSGSGGAYLVLQGGGNAAIRTFNGLKKNGWYTLGWLGASRPDFHSESEMITVSANDKTLVEMLRMPEDRFQQYAYTFQANSDGEAEVTFLNSSPTEVVCKESDPEQNAKGIYTKMCGSLAVFIDNVEVREIVDCGEGASCHVNLAPRTGYSCVCDDDGYFGFRTVNGKATCKSYDDETDAEVISKQVAELKTASDAAEATSKLLADTVENNKQGVLELASSLDNFNENNTNIVGKISDDLDDLKGRVATLEGQNKQLMDANAALIAAMKGVAVDPGRDEPSSSNAFAPTIETNGVDLMLSVQDGRHVKVNGEQLLTKEEVREIIKLTIQEIVSTLD